MKIQQTMRSAQRYSSRRAGTPAAVALDFLAGGKACIVRRPGGFQ
jgi:hypothetical protein